VNDRQTRHVMKNILITGGAGYVGSHVSDHLVENGYKVTIIDNLSTGHRELIKSEDVYILDLRDKPSLQEVFAKNKFDAVMHFAACSISSESVQDPCFYYENNLVGTINLLSCMVEHQVKHLVFSSTCAVYGNPEHIPVTENESTLPVSPYGRSKLYLENIMQDVSASHDFRYVSLRYFNAAGARPHHNLGEWHTPETHLIPRVIDVATNDHNNLEIYGNNYNTPDGTCIRDYIHVDDLSIAHEYALRYLFDGGKSEVFNLGNGVGHSVLQIVAAVERITGHRINIKNCKKREGDPAMLISSNKKIENTLKWIPQSSSLENIIESSWQWHHILNNYKIN